MLDASPPTAELPVFIAQNYGRYDANDHDVWRILYERRMATLVDTGSAAFLSGMERIGLSADRVPNLEDVNVRLAARTGWRMLSETDNGEQVDRALMRAATSGIAKNSTSSK